MGGGLRDFTCRLVPFLVHGVEVCAGKDRFDIIGESVSLDVLEAKAFQDFGIFYEKFDNTYLEFVVRIFTGFNQS